MHLAPFMRRAAHLLALCVAPFALLGACGQKRPAPSARAATTTATVTALPPVGPAAPSASADEQAADREKRPRLGEAAVYVDGKPAGVLRATELPARLEAHVIDLGGGYSATRYRFAEYARAMGLDPARVRAVHLYGGSRVAIVDEAEWKRIGDKLSFSFLQGDRGKPRVHWPPLKLEVNTTIDLLSNVAFYVDKAPPRLEGGQLVMPDGTKVEGKVPYAPEEQGNGTRVYVDGTLVGTVKRKKLTSDLAVPAKDDDATRFSLVGYASRLSPAAARAKAVDLVSGDDVVARLPAPAARSLTFHVPARNRGQAVVDVPVDAGHRSARISAIQLFVSTVPPARPLTKLDDARDATPSASDKTGGGGNADDE